MTMITPVLTSDRLTTDTLTSRKTLKNGVLGYLRFVGYLFARYMLTVPLKTTGSTGGFRLDAIKHMDSHFLRDFVGDYDVIIH
jgi:hypothetical protein